MEEKGKFIKDIINEVLADVFPKESKLNPTTPIISYNRSVGNGNSKIYIFFANLCKTQVVNT